MPLPAAGAFFLLEIRMDLALFDRKWNTGKLIEYILFLKFQV